jgi:hypothetical protein
MSTEKKNVYQRLFEFQRKDYGIVKSKKAHQYSYAPLDDIIDIVKPHLITHGLLIVHNTIIRDGVDIVVTNLININDTTGDFITCETEIKKDIKIGSMNPIMVVGAQITYIRRYHVVTILGLTTEEDTDTNPTSSAKATVASGEPIQTGPNYVKIFTNQLTTGKDQASITKSLNNYKAKMTADDFKNVSDLISNHFNVDGKTNAKK